MIPVISTLTLAFLSFFASAFVILRVMIPILPPHPLSKRVAPAEFGLPNFRKLSPADKAHVWLASLDIFALAIFVWQVVNEARGGPSDLASALDTTSSLRLWTILTIRQTMLLVIVFFTLLHVRLGRPISFGRKHWVLWAPSLVLVITSTAMTGILSSIGVGSLFFGLIAYSSTVTAITLIAFTFLLTTLFVIKRNLTAINEEMDSWPPVREILEKPRPSFATEDIDALRETGSWISSNSSTSSRHCSISAWSFSTQHSARPSLNGHGRPQIGGHHSVPAKSAYWFGADSREEIPPVPPLPLPYNRASPCMADPDPFRRDTPRPRLESQTSWLTSSDGSRSTMSAWSFPTTKNEPSIYTSSMRDGHTSSTLVSQSINPALGSAQVLGGYGFNPSEAEKAIAPCSNPPSSILDVSLIRSVGWFLFILVPYAFSLPYLVIVSQKHTCPLVVSTFFTLSILLSSPILALNIIFRCSFPIPTGLFDASSQLSPDLGLPKPENFIPRSGPFEPKRSMTASVTVVEGSRSGDVWIAQGDAVDGKGKLGRAIEVLNPCPKLSVIPPQKCADKFVTQPSTIRNEFAFSESKPKNTENDGRKTESKATSHLSGDECLAITSKIMIAQRHYSALAQTVILPSTPPEKGEVMATGATTRRASGHLRSRSTTSVNGPSTPTAAASFRISPTPPPPFPLPPTPPSVRQALAITHKKSFSSGFNFNRPDDVTEIGAMTARAFPLFDRRLKVGDVARATDKYTICSSHNKSHGTKALEKVNELYLDTSSLHIASTPARELRNKKSGFHQKHYSLPSPGLGKGGMHSPSVWSAHTRDAIEDKVARYKYFAIPSNVEVGWRNTIFDAESIPNTNPLIQIQEHLEDQDDVNFLNPFGEANFSRATSNCTLRVEICGDLDYARNSLVGSAASTMTLFEDDTDFASGPVAESTPHNSFTERKTHRQPLSLRKHTHKRSGIVYIKSEKSMDDNVTPPDARSTSASTMTLWPNPAIKPLAPKANKLQHKVSNVSSILTGAKSNSNKANLRPLTLLQDRGTNTAASSTETRPLSLRKKQRKAERENADENLDPNISPGSHRRKLKSLKLARSETSKIRGVLRQTEVLPQVIVRPPSETEQSGFEYNFPLH